MPLWLRLSSIYNGLLAFFDLVIFSYYAFILRGSPIELGVLNAIWSIAFIVSNLVFGGLADRGRNKTLAALSLVFAMLTTITFLQNTKKMVAISYVFHALATTAHNLSTSVSILELIDSSRWYFSNIGLRIGTFASRGLFLVALSFTIGDSGLDYYLYLLVALALAQAAALPSIGLQLERGIYRLTKDIEEILHRASFWGFINSSINSSSIAFIAQRGLKREYELSVGRALFIIFTVSALGDYAFIAFTHKLAGALSYSSYLFFMGAVSVAIGPLLLLVSNILSGGRLLISTLMVLRGIIFMAFLPMIDSPIEGALFVLMSNMTFAGIEASLYSIYVNMTSGYRGNLFFIFRELGCIIGGLLGGVIWKNARFAYQYVIVLLLALGLFMLIARDGRSRWE